VPSHKWLCGTQSWYGDSGEEKSGCVGGSKEGNPSCRLVTMLPELSWFHVILGKNLDTMKYNMDFHICLHEVCGITVANSDLFIIIMFHSYSH
jgi:hypothetical protein